jgi:hypothetical protein
VSNNPAAGSPAIRAILIGGFTAGILDITYAMVAYGMIGVSPRIILQSVASGWLGKASYSGGWPTAALGLASHLAITCIMAAVFLIIARRLALVRSRPLLSGAVFGLGAFAVMNLVVVPLSAAAVQPPSGVFLIGGLLAHVFLVGTPIALAARRVFSP